MSVAVSSVKCLLVKASLCLEAAERPQWPRLYSLGRPRSCDRMPSLVGDRGPVLRVLGWALTRMRNISLVTTLPLTRKLQRSCVGNRTVSCLAT